jgi:hypothetical protein
MKIYANRCGMIESSELAFALKSQADERRAASLRARARARRRERWRERSQRGVRTASAFVAGLRAAMLRQPV